MENKLTNPYMKTYFILIKIKYLFINFTHNKSKNEGFGGFLILTTYPLVLLFRGFFYINLNVVCLVHIVNVLFYIFL